MASFRTTWRSEMCSAVKQVLELGIGRCAVPPMALDPAEPVLRSGVGPGHTTFGCVPGGADSFRPELRGRRHILSPPPSRGPIFGERSRSLKEACRTLFKASLKSVASCPDF